MPYLQTVPPDEESGEVQAMYMTSMRAYINTNLVPAGISMTLEFAVLGIVLAAVAGFKWGFWAFGVLLSVWLVIFALMARNAPSRGPRKSLAEIIVR